MKNTRFFQLLYLISLFLFSSITSNYAQAELNDNGALNDVGLDGFLNVWEGAYQEYKIPTNPEFDYVRFYLKGGDGGTATVGCNAAQGGDGATVELSIKIGNAPDEIPAGTILRFVVGKRGQDHTSSVEAYSGGGGGTGIIWMSSPIGNIPLAVAGGGGGAKRRELDGKNGQGG